MKNLLILMYSFLLGSHSFAFHTDNVNEKLLREFKETFPNAEAVIWKELPESYLVNFVEDGIRARIIYGKDGEFISSTRYYLERNLPYYLIVNIRKRYPGKTIFGVTEFCHDSEVEYYIKMQDSKVWTTIKVDSEGNLNLVEKYKKAS